MKFKKDIYLYDTAVENIFINEYMPEAPGDFVKVYLYGLFYAENGGEIDDNMMANQLKLSKAQIAEALDYWQEKGLIEESDGSIKFKMLKMAFAGNDGVEFELGTLTSTPKVAPQPEKVLPKAPRYATSIGVASQLTYDDGMDYSNIRNIFEQNFFDDEAKKEFFEEISQTVGAPLSTNDIREINTWVSDFRINPEIIKFAFEYCVDKGKRSVAYVERVLIDWGEKGLETIEEIMEYLGEQDERQATYKRILQRLGFLRNATEKEKEIMDGWMDEMQLPLDAILDACDTTASLSNPNFNYVDKVLRNRKENAEKGVGSLMISKSELAEYMASLREEAENLANMHRQEVYEKVPRIQEIEEALQGTSADISRYLLKGNFDLMKAAKDKIAHLTEEKEALLEENGYPMNYFGVKYLCNECNDTGLMENGQTCDCMKDRAKEAELWIKKKKQK